MKKLLILFLILLCIPVANANLMKDISEQQEKIKESVTDSKFQSLLPIKLHVIAQDTQEGVYFLIQKSGDLLFENQGKDFEVYANYKEIQNFLNFTELGEIRDNIKTLNIRPDSVKGKIAVRFAEVFYNIKISEAKSWSHKLLNFFITPLAKIVKGLI